MKYFTYERAHSPAEAAAAASRIDGAKFIAGGTNLLDLMKLEIETPAHLIDVNGLALDTIEATPEGGLRIGALVRKEVKARKAGKGVNPFTGEAIDVKARPASKKPRWSFPKSLKETFANKRNW